MSRYSRQRILVVGASGKLGAGLVASLAANHFTVLAAGRDLSKLRVKFPTLEICTYIQLLREFPAVDAVIYLTAINSDQKLAGYQFYRINAVLPSILYKKAIFAGCKKFIVFSSIKAIDPFGSSPYATSKRSGWLRLKGKQAVTVFFLPNVIGNKLHGKLSLLNGLPGFLKGSLVYFLKAVRPTLDEVALHDSILETLKSDVSPSEVRFRNQMDKNSVYLNTKRFIDICVSVGLLAALAPVMILVWFLVRATSQGPGILVQERVGKNGKKFNCLKFRTMNIHTPTAASHLVSDQYVTPIGRLLRKSKLDELPQLLNVLWGDMTLVGPRPCLPSQTELVLLRKAHGVLTAVPGVTGLAQINGLDMSNPNVLTETDVDYLALRSLSLDVLIFFRTLLGKGINRDALYKAE